MEASRAALWAVLLCGAFCFSAAAAEHVLTLDSDNFDSEIEKHDFLVAEFYAPWCGHCKKLEPEYEEAAKKLKEENISIVLAKVNADEDKNKPLAAKYEVQGFPTLKIFRKDVGVSPYNGPRDAEGIVNYLKKQGGPASLEIGAAHVAKVFFEDNKSPVVGVFKAFEGPEFEAFQKVANKLRDEYSFAHTTDASLLPSEKGPAMTTPSIRLFKTFDEGYSDSSDFDVEKIPGFLEKASTPQLAELSKDPKARDMLMKVFNSPLNKVLMFFDYTASDGDSLLEAYKKVAPTYKGELLFIYGDVAENDQALKYFGVEEKDAPMLILHDQEVDKKYIDKDIEVADVEKFLLDFKAGKLEATVKSEEVPETNDGPVKVLVAKNFEDEVLNSKKNVMIEFYAPWCGHCKSLAPIYEEVGSEFTDDESVVIAKMDATANDVPTALFDVKGFPTLYFYTAKGNILPYEGNRTKKDLVDFVKKNKEESSGDTPEDVAEAKQAAEGTEAEPEEVRKDEL